MQNAWCAERFDLHVFASYSCSYNLNAEKTLSHVQMRIVQCKRIEFANRNNANVIVVAVFFIVCRICYGCVSFSNLFLNKSEYEITITRTFAIFKPSWCSALELAGWLDGWMTMWSVDCELSISSFCILHMEYGCHFNVVIVREKTERTAKKKKNSSKDIR